MSEPTRFCCCGHSEREHNDREGCMAGWSGDCFNPCGCNRFRAVSPSSGTRET